APPPPPRPPVAAQVSFVGHRSLPDRGAGPGARRAPVRQLPPRTVGEWYVGLLRHGGRRATATPRSHPTRVRRTLGTVRVDRLPLPRQSADVPDGRCGRRAAGGWL